MPIYEYSCGDCGTRFEQLVRRAADTSDVRCPSCGKDHLRTEYSTFAAHGGKSSAGSSPAPGGCGSGMCGTDYCGSGACGMNFN